VGTDAGSSAASCCRLDTTGCVLSANREVDFFGQKSSVLSTPRLRFLAKHSESRSVMRTKVPDFCPTRACTEHHKWTKVGAGGCRDEGSPLRATAEPSAERGTGTFCSEDCARPSQRWCPASPRRFQNRRCHRRLYVGQHRGGVRKSLQGTQGDSLAWVPLRESGARLRMKLRRIPLRIFAQLASNWVSL
jgi:hypothetical protein